MKKRFKNILSKMQKRNGLPLLIAAVVLIVGMSAAVGCSVKEEPAPNLDASSDSTTPDAVMDPKPVSAGHCADDTASAETAPAEDIPEESLPEQTLSDEALAVKDAAEAFSGAFFAADEKTLRQYLADNYEYPVELYSYPAEMAQNITFRGG